MEKTIKKLCSILICVVMLVMTGCASNQAGYLTLGDVGAGQVTQLIARAGTDASRDSESEESDKAKESDKAEESDKTQEADKSKESDNSKKSDSSTGSVDTDKQNLEPKHADVVIQVAVTVELDGVLKAFGVEDAEHCYDTASKYDFSYYRFNKHGLEFAVVMQPYMGMTYCSSLCSRAILAFEPDLVCMVGICAGRASKVNLGDIVVAASVFDYAEGKQYENKFAARPKTRSLDYMISEFVSTEIVDKPDVIDEIRNGYKNAPSNFAVSFHSMASGAVVVDDPAVMEAIAEIQDDTVALDMEGYALAAAADLLDTKWIVIKTVQDFADGNKSSTEGDIRPFAAYSSAKLLDIILERITKDYWDQVLYY